MSKPVAQFGSDISWMDTLAADSDFPVDEGLEEGEGGSLYPLLPLRDMVVYPRMVVPLEVDWQPGLLAVEAAMATDDLLVVVAQRDSLDEEHAEADLYPVGTEVKIARVLRMPDGSTSILVQGRQRVRLTASQHDEEYPTAIVAPLWENAQPGLGTEALMRAALALFEKVVDLSPQLSEEAYVAALNATEPGWLADVIASTLQAELAVKQELLELVDPNRRLQRVSVLLGKELDVLELESRIHARVQEEVDKSQREYFLREQMRVIQMELGDLDEQGQVVADLRARLEAARLPEKARLKATEELHRLATMPAIAPEVSVIRSYLEWLVDLPWTQTTDDNVDLGHAAKVLASNHFGLPQAKDRILEHMAVRRLAGEKMRTPILCFVGAPGTGKTSMGRSVAQALGRRFLRVSLGGVRDEAEIRGHRRTYVSALPGRIIQAMRGAGTVNPVFMLDEIDKLGQDFRGDPAAALLEILDPEQNHEFSDHYLDVAYDLSNVLFITTANTLDAIPEALLDRLEVIRFPGYIEEEKLRIAHDYLVPRQVEQTGLRDHRLVFGEGVLRTMIREHTYEAGVRGLERCVAAVCRKVARRVAEGKPAPHRITPGMLNHYLGPPEFHYGMAEEEDQVGVASGVAWTEAGGDLMQVEVTVMPGKGNLTLTGQLGEVMQESAQAALSYARSHASEWGIGAADFEEQDIHIHLPEGAIPKDGPSAGITMATALISALTGRPVRREVGMTGEITLRGRVLAVGGLKEKAIAAHRAGLKTLLIPKMNEKALADMPRRIKRDLAFVAVARMEEVLELALLASQEGRTDGDPT